MREIKRSKLVTIVNEAAFSYFDGIQREHVLNFARRTSFVLTGAWSKFEGGRYCYCPSSGAGIDRFSSGAGAFAFAFDTLMGLEFDAEYTRSNTEVFKVIDDA